MRHLTGNKKQNKKSPLKQVTLGFPELDTNLPLVHITEARKEIYLMQIYFIRNYLVLLV